MRKVPEPLILDGRAAARAIRAELAREVDRLRAGGCSPKLAILLAGDYAPSQIYVRSKERACREAGILVETAPLPANSGLGLLQAKVEAWNRDDSVHGIIVQLPLPDGLDSTALVDAVSPTKDVDGLTTTSSGLLMKGTPGFVPATPAGIVELLVRNRIALSGRRVVVVGRSELVGKPLANLLLLRGERGDATVTVCHTKTANLGAVCRSAEILVAAAGRAGLVTGEMVAEGAVVVDAGINRTEEGIVGDVDFPTVVRRVSAITPVPGGVGPMTVAMLLANTVRAAREHSAGHRAR
ncbi:MAG: bifunctional 5,10-methylenetetrahydrofolate dehydrogenase/5,10-methenyltetrahydrofolate cyclohydrolase [Gemmatimonadetes bacterium]|nr:bifunctional 5,10-methylenetetrahydrofolate dehydrogenase/5,10-methenyltetrahydrofolate cyclohydrolase [Gemmatimonadota bacterium]